MHKEWLHRADDDELNQLNRYYIETRYPGDYPEFTKTEAESAAEAALRIKEYILGCLDKK